MEMKNDPRERKLFERDEGRGELKAQQHSH